MQKKEKKNSVPTMQDRLRELADDYGGNTGLADQTGISRQSIGAYINGDRTPDCAILKQISERTGVSADWLLGLSNMRHVDASVKSVCVHTGISPDSLEVYDALRSANYNELPRAMDILMQNPQFPDLIVSILSLYCLGFGGSVTAPAEMAFFDSYNDRKMSLEYNAGKIFSYLLDDLSQHGEQDHDELLRMRMDHDRPDAADDGSGEE